MSSFADSEIFTITGAWTYRDADFAKAVLESTVYSNVNAAIIYGGQFGSQETHPSIRRTAVNTFWEVKIPIR